MELFIACIFRQQNNVNNVFNYKEKATCLTKLSVFMFNLNNG